MRALERTVKFDPTRGDAFLNLGVEYYNRGRWDEAEEMLLKAKQFVPSFNYPMIDSYLKNVSLQRHGETQVR
jgi:tetratricopeptide (TPR) repeat protein